MVTKFTGGKRVNVVKRGSYYACCMGAGLAQISSSLCLQYKEGPSKKRRRVDNTGPDMEYGPSAAEIINNYIKKMKLVLEDLNSDTITFQMIRELERNTLVQHENIRWRDAHLNRLTAI
ncbi:hypothetical protein PR048_011301 [Dryococelus australis]|uniref:Uncharacterized protein n=1 Tax=Dryococelus australis TaxID=614101 RepID=A0ABQ9HL65_9NEOP|nr:hypothetical protein PR048_011301 [Dryococelus australis]